MKKTSDNNLKFTQLSYYNLLIYTAHFLALNSYHVCRIKYLYAKCILAWLFQCEFVPGRRFSRGGYKCNCKQGYEYPFYDPTTFYDGDIMEVEYLKKQKDLPNRFDQLVCRIGGASVLYANIIMMVLFAGIAMLSWIEV